MKIFLLEREDCNITWNEVWAYLICAESETDAFEIAKTTDEDGWQGEEEISCKILGEALPDIERGIILKSETGS